MIGDIYKSALCTTSSNSNAALALASKPITVTITIPMCADEQVLTEQVESGDSVHTAGEGVVSEMVVDVVVVVG